MKRLIALCFSLLLSLSLFASCETDGSSTTVSGEAIASFSENVPLHAACSDGLWYLLLGKYGQTGGSLHVGADAASAEAVFTLPDTATVHTFCARQELAVFTCTYTDDDGSTVLAVFCYDRKSGSTAEIGKVSATCKTAVIADQTVFWVDETGKTLQRYEPETKTVTAVVQMERVHSLSASEDQVILCDPQQIVCCRPDSEPISYSLPATIARIDGIAYDAESGIFALRYTDAQTGAESIGTWFPRASEVHPMFTFQDNYTPAEHPIAFRNGIIYWITLARMPGLTAPHARIVAWDTQTGNPCEYMKAYAFTLDAAGLTFPAFDRNNDTDHVTLYTDKTPASEETRG